MDADEEVPYGYNIWRLLRPSGFNAYALPQIHYSAMPAQVLTTDFPCRLFRNFRGVKFYGCVHEHPEESPGKAISHTMLSGDIQFLHSGYTDERIRRDRYQRNLPLLFRDVEENPERYLNKFLLLRDLSQAIGFEQQCCGGLMPGSVEKAQQGIGLFEDLVNNKRPLRMIVDALPYYSVCVEACQPFGAFDSNVELGVGRVGTPSMAASTNFKGRFADKKTWLALINYIAEESVKNYESKYA
jgi:hypothetical protein